MRLFAAVVLSILCGLPAMAQTGPDFKVRDESSRLAVAVLGRVCLMNQGDVNGVVAATAAGGEFGFVPAPDDVSQTVLQGRSGHVRVLRRPGLGAITVAISLDGICSVWSEYADAGSIQRHLIAMVDKGGMKGGGQLLPLDARDADGVRITDYYFVPAGWYAAQLGKRFGDDGTSPLAMVSTVSPPGRRAVEAVISVSRPLKQAK